MLQLTKFSPAWPGPQFDYGSITSVPSLHVLFNGHLTQRVLELPTKMDKRLLTELTGSWVPTIYRVHAYGINFAIQCA